MDTKAMTKEELIAIARDTTKPDRVRLRAVHDVEVLRGKIMSEHAEQDIEKIKAALVEALTQAGLTAVEAWAGSKVQTAPKLWQVKIVCAGGLNDGTREHAEAILESLRGRVPANIRELFVREDGPWADMMQVVFVAHVRAGRGRTAYHSDHGWRFDETGELHRPSSDALI